jgi:hypothetical protein
MLGLAVLGFLLLWLFAILLAMIIGWKIGKHFKYPIWGRLLGMALGFYATVGWYITQEAKEYYREKRLVTEFCQKYPRYEVFVSPEELKKITPDNAEHYAQYRYTEMEQKTRKEKAISFRGSVYYQSSSTLEMMKKRKKFISYHEFKDIGNYSLNRIIYVDDKYKLVLYLENFTGGGSGSDGGKYLGLKFWFDYIIGCERLVQGLKELDEQYLVIYQEKAL